MVMTKEKSILRVVGISGSLRRESFNRKALQTAKKIALEMGVDVDEIDLKELNIPMYDGDIESNGFPDAVQRLRNKVESADMLIIATPEYNHSISGALKNAIDWLSTGKNILDGKTAAIFGASNGLFGTMRAQAHLRQILNALNVIIAPQPQLFIRSAKEAFALDGSLSDQKLFLQMQKLIKKTIELTVLIKENKQ
ncbi:MAG: NADPH-dependent oxidoreductase [Chlorobiaceae bacterium]|nr:NADPH-dependent oxidoreductase [Chlorobiaceae bacterium]